MTKFDAWKNLAFYVITIISLITLLIEVKQFLFKIKSRNRKKNEYINLQYRKYYKRLLIYFFAQLLIFGPFSASRFLEITYGFDYLSQYGWWNYLKEILLSSTGLVFSVIYGYMNNKFKNELRKLMNKDEDMFASDIIKLDDFDRAVLDDLSSDPDDNDFDSSISDSESQNIFM